MKRLTLACLIIVLSSLVFLSVGYAKKKKSTCGATSFENCPVEGCGGDPLLNEKKNTTTQPAAADIEKLTRADFADLTFPASWASGTPRALLESWGEGKPVEFMAYLIKVKHYPSGQESCNCNLKLEENNDFHLVLVSRKNASEDDSITAEITPHIRPDGWTFQKLKNLADNKRFIKAVGYLMLDTQHISNPLARLTNWEIHPVTSFQVCTGTITARREGSDWEDLANIPEP